MIRTDVEGESWDDLKSHSCTGMSGQVGQRPPWSPALTTTPLPCSLGVEDLPSWPPECSGHSPRGCGGSIHTPPPPQLSLFPTGPETEQEPTDLTTQNHQRPKLEPSDSLPQRFGIGCKRLTWAQNLKRDVGRSSHFLPSAWRKRRGPATETKNYLCRGQQKRGPIRRSRNKKE